VPGSLRTVSPHDLYDNVLPTQHHRTSHRWTHPTASGEYTLMRWVFLLAGLTAAALQTACGTTPQQFGITGPAPQTEPTLTPDDATVRAPGLPDANTGSGFEQRYYNYN